VAHNAEFDKAWIETREELTGLSHEKKWICTKRDVKWPVHKGCSLSLVNICVDLSVPIHTSHRALADCTLLLGALDQIVLLEDFLKNSGKGRFLYHAKVDYTNRQSAKDEGFQWDNLNKVWYTMLTPDEADKMPFECILADKC
jgi:DNA polymerase III epsilon subunit-like protein